MIKLFGGASPNVFKVVIMLEETGLPYELVWVDHYQGDNHAPDFVAMSPSSKVPVIVDEEAGGLSVFESGAILIYLGEKTGRFLAAREPDRSIVVSWLMFQMSAVGPILGQQNHFFRYADEVVPYAQDRYGRESRRLLQVMDDRLASAPFLGGADYSIADMAVYPWIRILDRMGLRDSCPPHLLRWATEIEARPVISGLQARFDALAAKAVSLRATAEPHQIDRFFNRTPHDQRGWEAPDDAKL